MGSVEDDDGYDDGMHTPYDGSSKLFQIGLKPLDLADWIDPDDRLAAALAEKERLAAAHWDDVFAAEPGTEGAQAELLALLVAHLPARFPHIYRLADGAMEVAGRRVPLDTGPALSLPSKPSDHNLPAAGKGTRARVASRLGRPFPGSAIR